MDTFEPIVASVAFYAYIGTWKLIDFFGRPSIIRFTICPEHDPIKAEGGVWEYFSPINSTDKPGFIALFFYLSPLALFDFVFPRRQSREYFHLPPPTTLQLMAHICLSIFVYDLLFYFPHLFMHLNRNLYKSIHCKHHTKRKLCAVEVVRHTFIDGLMQVSANIITLNLLGLPAFSRMVHNLVVTYMLTEIHSGYDMPWMLHNILPRGILAGSPVHEAHHQYGNKGFHQFFTYFDKLLGYEFAESLV
ncbi:hypothetical protein AAMO2058_000151300 [Amorphochlora amoebiformis]